MSGKDWLFSLILTLIVMCFVEYPRIALIGTVTLIISILFIYFLTIKVLDYSSRKKKERLEFLKNTYPHAYWTFRSRNHIWKSEDYFTNNDYKKFSLSNIDEWKSLEMKYWNDKKINDEYEKLKLNYPIGLQCWEKENLDSSKSEANHNREQIIKYNKKQKEFIRLEQWENNQKQFCTLVNEKSINMYSASKSSIDIQIPRVDFQKQQINGIYRLFHFIFLRYCTDHDLDYTNFKSIKSIGENLECFKLGKLAVEDCVHHEIADFLNALELPLNVFIFAEEIGEKEEARILTGLLQSKGIKTFNLVAENELSSRNIVIIDIVSSHKQVKERLIKVFNKYHSFEPCILYISFVSEVSSHVMQQMIDRKNDILRKQKLREEQRIQVLNEITVINNELISCKLEQVQKKLNDLKSYHSSKETDKELIDLINKEEERIEQCYKEGIVENLPVQYVDYRLPFETETLVDWSYPVVKYATYRSVVFPYRRRLIARRGYTENKFQAFLSNVLKESGLLILGDCNILVSDNCRPYEPDIAIICEDYPSIRIDVEIDEPYAAILRKPIHYVSGGDDFRDENLNNIGWTVIRFTERQVFDNPKGCAAFIAQVFQTIKPSLHLPVDLINYPIPENMERWTEIEAKLMACEKLREKYLNHKFSIEDNEQLTQADIKQTDLEKKCAGMVLPIHIGTMIPNSNVGNYPKNIAERDKNIQFSAYEHVYLYRGKQQLIPVSNVISYFFKPFDSFYWSARKADQWHVPQGQVLEEWDAKGAMSTQVGTFMHKQIENYYNGGNYGLNYHFTYNGKYIHQDEEVEIDTEKYQFDLFINDHPFTPFRTEWAIYDEDMGIAGTIDMIRKDENGAYEIYDWKRSHRIIDSVGEPITTNYYGERGIRGLEIIEDTIYWHYCLQQNLYKYMLEKNYGIKVEKMFLVVFTNDRIEYTKLEVPKLDDIIQIIIKAIRQGEMKQLLEDIQ